MNGDTTSPQDPTKRGLHALSLGRLAVLLIVLIVFVGGIAYSNPTARMQMMSWYGEVFGGVDYVRPTGNLYLTLKTEAGLSARTLDVETGDLVSRTLDGGRALEWMALSPSGSQRAYFLRKSGDMPAEIRVYTPSTNDRVTVLSPAPETARQIRWSPDEQTLVFSAREKGIGSDADIDPDTWVVYTVPVTGGEMERVALGTTPFFSPDGSLIFSLQSGGLAATSLTDGTKKIVRGMQGGEAHRFMDIDISPDGTKLLWTNPLSANREGKLFVFDVLSWSPVSISQTAHVVKVPALQAVFSPDGRFVAFLTNPSAESDANPGIYTLDLKNLLPILLMDLSGFELGSSALTDWR